MHIEHIEISNFRKLERVRIDFSEETTIFVGANNSGKTSAMEALQKFLIEDDEFSINDITLTLWTYLNAAAEKWESGAEKAAALDWDALLPFIDIWLNVPTHELHYVQKLIPTIDWDGEKIGVRLRCEPKDITALEQAYVTARQAAQAVAAAADNLSEDSTNKGFALWPTSFMDFLSRRLAAMFTVRAYLLDPAQLVAPKAGLANPQKLPSESEPIQGDPLEGLIRVDRIGAQRGLGSSISGATRSPDRNEDTADVRAAKKLSSQLRSYYNSHLDPLESPDPEDFQALAAVHGAQKAFGDRLEESFKGALKELEKIGYPGVTDPILRIVPNIKPVDGLRHATAVQYEVPTKPVLTEAYRLPEDSNGLGYQNLVLITFELMRFRDRWMKKGKAGKVVSPGEAVIPPLHLVLIEEPEAHLHAQVQQVFIKQAYQVLRNHDRLLGSTSLRTQLVISTHSTHVAHEADFAALRYFRRLPPGQAPGSVPVCSVINLSEVFGPTDQTERFVKRYLKATHCDLFFADGVILVEGPAERILVPHLMHSRVAYDYLARSYVTWLEIGGSHAHRLRSLIEHLGLNTLIITDIDAKDGLSGKSAPPKRHAGQKTRNSTLKKWVPAKEQVDTLLDTTPGGLAANNVDYAVRVAYQQPIAVIFKTSEAEALANTFEDALVYENLELFKSLKGDGLIAVFREAIEAAAGIPQLAEKLAAALTTGSKAELALDLLYSDEIDMVQVPGYIHEGLLWLQEQLKRREDEVLGRQEKQAAA
ncbi:MAG: AAA family ATPase [Gammaproteobacteria bacterium]